MTCYHPITALLPVVTDSEGKKRLIFNEKKSNLLIDDSPIVRDVADYAMINGFKIKIPCGRCIGCRLDYSRQWAIRSLHESIMSPASTFVTLTFNDEHLPINGSVSKAYLSSWIKRFRRRFGENIRFMACGEYGSKNKRPHYHILFYNFDFPDKKYWMSRHGQIYYRSQMLEDLWREPYSSESNGFSVIGDVTFESSAYVARYITKKMFGALADDYYKKLGISPEFLNMSRDPGLGNSYVHKYFNDLISHGCCRLKNGVILPLPRYYVNEFKKIDEEKYNLYKLDKLKELYNNLFVEDLDSTQERLQVREELKKVKCDKLVRIYEFDGNLHNIY